MTGDRHRGRGPHGAVVGAVLAVALAAGCDLYTTVDPDRVGSIAADSLPFPAVVVGDTLRDSTGAVAPLTARVFAADGSPMPDAEVRWLALDSGIVVDSVTGVVRGTALRATGARVVALAGGLQSQPLTIFTTVAPTTLASAITVPADSTPTLALTVGFDVGTNQQVVPMRVLAITGSDTTAVRGWRVTYRIVGETPAFVDSLRLTVPNTLNRSTVAVTDAAGAAQRALRVFVPFVLLDPATDTATVTIEARASYRGMPLAGSPAQVRVFLRPAG